MLSEWKQRSLTPLLPLSCLYACTTCVCAGCSVAVCPFCPVCHFMLFPLLLEGKPFLGRACSSSVTLNLLYWHVLSSWKYKLEYWFTQTLDLDLQEFIQHRVTPRSCLCMVTSPIKGRDKADTLTSISIELNAVVNKISGCGPLSGRHQPSESDSHGLIHQSIALNDYHLEKSDLILAWFKIAQVTESLWVCPLDYSV